MGKERWVGAAEPGEPVSSVLDLVRNPAPPFRTRTSDDVRRVYRLRRLLPFSAFSSLFWRKAFPDLARIRYDQSRRAGLALANRLVDKHFGPPLSSSRARRAIEGWVAKFKVGFVSQTRGDRRPRDWPQELHSRLHARRTAREHAVDATSNSVCCGAHGSDLSFLPYRTVLSRVSKRMRISSAILVATAALLALPVGWGVGVVLAYAVAGRDFGQPPVLTVPVSMVAAIVFALSLSMSAEKCLAIMVVGAAIFVLLALLSPHL